LFFTVLVLVLILVLVPALLLLLGVFAQLVEEGEDALRREGGRERSEKTYLLGSREI